MLSEPLQEVQIFPSIRLPLSQKSCFYHIVQNSSNMPRRDEDDGFDDNHDDETDDFNNNNNNTKSIKNRSNINDNDTELMGDKLRAPADFQGPTANRQCTDILCTGLLIAMWISMTILGLQAISGGDFRILLYPLDFDGNICGTDYGANMSDYPYLVYVNNWGGGVCVKECPSLQGRTSDNATDIRTLLTYGGVYQIEGAELSSSYIGSLMPDYANQSNDSIVCTQQTCFPDPTEPSTSWSSLGISQGFGFAYYIGDSYPLLSYCMLTQNATARILEQVGPNATLSAAKKGADVWCVSF
jgi:hypothetical protein